MDSRLLLTATPDLLEGWTGPVLLETQGAGWVEGVVLDGEVVAHTGEAGRVWVDHLDLGRVCHVRLDLSRAECRDRVARVVAALLFRDLPPNGDGFSWRSEPVGICWELRSHNLNWTARFGPDTSRWFAADEGNRTGRFPSRSVPALAGLNPFDDTRLPDGSRLVDALALALVAEEVLRG